MGYSKVTTRTSSRPSLTRPSVPRTARPRLSQGRYRSARIRRQGGQSCVTIAGRPSRCISTSARAAALCAIVHNASNATSGASRPKRSCLCSGTRLGSKRRRHATPASIGSFQDCCRWSSLFWNCSQGGRLHHVSWAPCRGSVAPVPAMNGGDSGVGPAAAVWLVWSRADRHKLDAFLENRYRLTHPVERRELRVTRSDLPAMERWGIVPFVFLQAPGDVVVVPAGCVHQVVTIRSSVTAATDVALPWSLPHIMGVRERCRAVVLEDPDGFSAQGFAHCVDARGMLPHLLWPCLNAAVREWAAAKGLDIPDGNIAFLPREHLDKLRQMQRENDMDGVVMRTPLCVVMKGNRKFLPRSESEVATGSNLDKETYKRFQKVLNGITSGHSKRPRRVKAAWEAEFVELPDPASQLPSPSPVPALGPPSRPRRSCVKGVSEKRSRGEESSDDSDVVLVARGLAPRTH